jgi:toxin ParE1/3/4
MILLSRDALQDVERLRTFLDQANPGAARRALTQIWTAIEKFPAMGAPTGDPNVRQLVIRFGVSGHIVRYVIVPDTQDVLVTRIWHGREPRT